MSVSLTADLAPAAGAPSPLLHRAQTAICLRAAKSVTTPCESRLGSSCIVVDLPLCGCVRFELSDVVRMAHTLWRSADGSYFVAICRCVGLSDVVWRLPRSALLDLRLYGWACVVLGSPMVLLHLTFLLVMLLWRYLVSRAQFSQREDTAYRSDRPGIAGQESK